jgi:hypothetical protein
MTNDERSAAKEKARLVGHALTRRLIFDQTRPKPQ